MPTRASTHRWALRLIAWGAVLAALGLAGLRDVTASTCHTPDRPAVGLDFRTADPAPDLASAFDRSGDRTASPAPGYRPAPCAGDPADRPGSWDPPVGRLDPAPAAAPAHPSGPIAPLDPPDAPAARPDGRLERPPRSA